MPLIDTSGLAHYDEEYVQPIMDSIAPTESGSASAHDYAIGQEFYHDNLLYKAKTAITTGDTFVVGTNIELAQDLASQISNAGGGGLIDTTWQDYQALPEQQKLDPGKAFFIEDLDFDYDNLRDIVAPTEAATAVGNRAIGDEFILGDYLYKAIAAISQGDSIVTSGTGQNATLAGTIVSQLKALFDGETVLKRTQNGNTVSNIDFTYESNGIRYYLVYASSQAPDMGTYHLIDLTISSYYSLQFIMPVDGTAIYMRHRSGAWDTTWKQIYGFQRLYQTASGTLAISIPQKTDTAFLTLSLPAGTYIAYFTVRKQGFDANKGRIFPFIHNSSHYKDWGEKINGGNEAGDDYTYMFTLSSQTSVSAGVYSEVAINFAGYAMFQAMRIN